MANYLRVTGFPNCCGAVIISGFPCEHSGNVTSDNANTIEEDIKSFDKYGGAFAILILTENQRRNFKKMIYSYGFRMRSKGNNSGGNNLYTYIKVITDHDPNKVMED